MVRYSSICILLLCWATTLHAGLAITPKASPILPGSTVVFDLAIVNPTAAGTIASVDTIGPNLAFAISTTTGIGTPPSFTTSGTPDSVGNWSNSIFDANFLSTNLSPAAALPATFGQLSVDIPNDFFGGFAITLLDDVAVMAGGPIIDQITGGTSFPFAVAATAVPEPNPLLLLVIVGSISGMFRYTCRTKPHTS